MFIYHSCLFWLKLYIYVGHWESCWECTVVDFVTEATMFGYGKNRVWYLLQKWNVKHAKNMRSQHPHPFFVCDDQNLWNSALPQPATLKKKILTSQIIHGWYVYIYICSAPPKQKTKNKNKKTKQNHGDCRISNGFGFFVFVFFVFSKGPSPKSLQCFFVGSMMFLDSLPGLLPKEDQNILGKL